MKRDILQTVSQDLGVKKDLVLLEAIKRHTGTDTVELDKLFGRLHRTYFTGDKIECWYLDDHPIVEFYHVEYITDDFKFKVEQRYRSIAPPIPRPRCYNRPECAPGYWGMHGRPAPGAKPRYRWVEHRMTRRDEIHPLDCPMCRERAEELAGEEFDRLEGLAWEFVIEDRRLLDLLNLASDQHERADVVGYAAKALMRNCRRDYIAKYWANHVDEAAEKIRIETDAEIAEMIAEGER